MTGQDYPPDLWSGHDFFVITVSGEQLAVVRRSLIAFGSHSGQGLPVPLGGLDK